MIKVRVKTVWQGEIAFNEKYLKEAKDTKQGISVMSSDPRYTGIMNIPVGDLDKLLRYSTEIYPDRYGNGFYHLVYFKWNPTAAQDFLI